ncbi:hypothetical protein HN803_03170 [candidate division WWE3 bacterium]|jgi:hypothetical protein|nr:hypothetical protein [Candidatus Scalindua sp.]MBT7349773.1 hypothetical protein [candidate division WWE3 bacterium]
MKIKVGNKICDGDDEPVMVILTNKDKENIANMAKGCQKYCEHPDTMDDEEIYEWMAE